METGFIRIIYTVHIILPPETFQRRNNIFKEACDFIIGLIAHFQRVGHGIQYTDGLLICTAVLVRVASAAHGNVVHWWHFDKLRLAFRHVEFSILFFEVKRHSVLLYFFQCLRVGTMASIWARTCSAGQLSVAICVTQKSISCSFVVYLKVPSA